MYVFKTVHLRGAQVIVLAPPITHVDTGVMISRSTWGTRGRVGGETPFIWNLRALPLQRQCHGNPFQEIADLMKRFQTTNFSFE